MKHNQSFESIYYNDVDSHFLIAMFWVDVAVTAAKCSPLLARSLHSSSSDELRELVFSSSDGASVGTKVIIILCTAP